MNREKIEQVIVEVLKDKFGDGSALSAFIYLFSGIPDENLFDAVSKASAEPIYEEINDNLQCEKIRDIVSSMRRVIEIYRSEGRE